MNAGEFTKFMEYVQADNGGCIRWIGNQAGAGYGYFRSRGAHRWAYEHFVGPIGEGLTIDHLCRNRLCINPLHLEAVTQGENVLRGNTVAAKNKAKTHCKNGHKFSIANTYKGRIGRSCRECHRQDEYNRRSNHMRLDMATHCRHGHERTLENTWIEKNGAQHCRVCHRLRERQRRTT